jgi:hypothetical protein
MYSLLLNQDAGSALGGLGTNAALDEQSKAIEIQLINIYTEG